MNNDINNDDSNKINVLNLNNTKNVIKHDENKNSEDDYKIIVIPKKNNEVLLFGLIVGICFSFILAIMCFIVYPKVSNKIIYHDKKKSDEILFSSFNIKSISSINVSESLDISISNNFKITTNVVDSVMGVSVNNKYLDNAYALYKAVAYTDDYLIIALRSTDNNFYTIYIVDKEGNISDKYNYAGNNELLIKSVSFSESSIMLSVSRVNSNYIIADEHTYNVCDDISDNTIITAKYSIKLLNNKKISKPMITNSILYSEYKKSINC